jgi:hypothetical protein
VTQATTGNKQQEEQQLGGGRGDTSSVVLTCLNHLTKNLNFLSIELPALPILYDYSTVNIHSLLSANPNIYSN